MSATIEPQKTWYVVEGENFTHVFEDEDEAHEMVLAEIVVWNGKTREPDCWQYIEEYAESEIPDLQSNKPIKFHKVEHAA